MLLQVAGLKLAVPLVALGQINRIDSPVTALFGQSTGLWVTTDSDWQSENR